MIERKWSVKLENDSLFYTGIPSMSMANSKWFNLIQLPPSALFVENISLLCAYVRARNLFMAIIGIVGMEY